MYKFERGLDPKVAMEIGGINFGEQFDDFFFNIWYKSIKSLEGKTITAIMTKPWIEGGKTKTKNSALHTVKIKKINEPELINMSSTRNTWKIRFEGEDIINNDVYLKDFTATYSLNLNQKIRIS